MWTLTMECTTKLTIKDINGQLQLRWWQSSHLTLTMASTYHSIPKDTTESAQVNLILSSQSTQMKTSLSLRQVTQQ
jgi:hypothetical protein